MKATGIVRRIDDLGRVVIPKELRRTMGIDEGDPVEFFTNDGRQVVVRKYQPGCHVCGNSDHDLHLFHGQQICSKCVSETRKYAKEITEEII
ncbi:AbrB/MazE/SpoVT family DNA-binding domain-containing protein [Paenibacillus cisolokensis]|uniref:AbrB/MazE/SpoVT family DNA-binding domain-containing protein n=1 Tax=Paenibacillus cisolokensis TaxID=1658519 RepID=UPI003D2D486A